MSRGRRRRRGASRPRRLRRARGRPAGVTDVRQAVADAHRREWAFVLAATVRVAGDIDLAEECVQHAYVAALDTWTRDGVPRNPGAWLTTAARRRALDAHRRARTLRDKLPLLVEPSGAAAGKDEVIPDDRLAMVFTCCHPALAREARVALTLRLVCGLTTTEIARAFLVPEPTMAARVTRAKKKIAGARIPFRVPDAPELPDRSRCRRRSPRCTRRRRATRRPTGRRCSSCTTRCCASGRRRWSRSTVRSRSRWCGDRTRRWPRSSRWSGRAASPATATCTRPRPTTCAGSTAARRRRPPTAPRSA
ncbi:MAG: RNA polymerase sigma factor [Streptosporangiaceae bacterium]